MRNIRKILALLLVLSTTASFTACIGSDSVIEDLDKVQGDIGESEVVEESSVDAPTKEGYTPTPIVTHIYNSGVNTAVVAGVCEKGAIVKASIANGPSATAVADGNRFALEIDLGDRSEPNVYVTAQVEGLKESEPRQISASADPNFRGNKVSPTILSEQFTLFSQSSIDALAESNVQSNSVIDSFKTNPTTGINAFLKNLGKIGDTELVFVLSPSRARVLADLLPEDVKVSGVSLYDQVKKALIDCGVTVIDLREAFGLTESENDTEKEDYPIFYKSHSGWSDYAAYLAYNEVMSYIAKEFPAAAPYGLEDFEIKADDKAMLGDLAYNFGLNKEDAVNYDPESDNYFTEVFYDFVLKKDLNIGTNYVPKVEATEESSDEVSSGESSEDSSADSSEESASSAESSEDTALKEFVESLSNISDIGLYLNANRHDYRPFNSYLTSKETWVDPTKVVSDSSFGFCTNRSDLPSAHIYRSEYCTPIIDMLAERFNNSYFSVAGDFNIKHNNALNYAGTEGNTNVDYIIVFITEEELLKLF